MMVFCTLFDSNYLSRGLAMYESLIRHCKDFHLYLFPFDQAAYDILLKLNLPKVTLVSLLEFEDEELLKVKPARSVAEYCWTSTSSIIFYVLKKFNVEHCTYLDADLYFYSDPRILLNEMGEKSILITEHRFTPDYDTSHLFGIYCVQFITFKNNKQGLKALTWWRNACLEWCYNREEEGKFGDQKYLDDWTSRFEGTHVLRNLGGGVAPWNIQQYTLRNIGDTIHGKEVTTGKIFPIIFYHFHYIRYYQNGLIDIGDYEISKDIIRVLYRPYLLHLEKIKENLQHFHILFDPHGPRRIESTWKTPLLNLKRRLYHRYNVYRIKSLFTP